MDMEGLPAISSHADEGDLCRCANEAPNSSCCHSQASLKEEIRWFALTEDEHQHTGLHLPEMSPIVSFTSATYVHGFLYPDFLCSYVYLYDK